MPKRLLIFAALILSACNLSAPGSLMTPTPETPIVVTTSDQPTPDYPTPAAAQTDWVVYENASQGYRLQYPASLSLVENAQNNEVVIGDQISMQVVDVNPEDARGGGTVIEEASDTLIGQIPARTLKGYVGSIGGNVPHSIQQVVIPRNGKYYVLTVSEIKRSEMVSNGREIRLQGPIAADMLALFNSIMTTIRFTD